MGLEISDSAGSINTSHTLATSSSARLRHGPRRRRVEAAGLALRVWPVKGLAEVQEPERTGREAGSGRGMGPIAKPRKLTFQSRGLVALLWRNPRPRCYRPSLVLPSLDVEGRGVVGVKPDRLVKVGDGPIQILLIDVSIASVVERKSKCGI
jgi:hypothetical protein